MESVINSVIPAKSDNISATADNGNHEVTDNASLSALHTACNDAYQLHRFSPVTV